MTAKSLYNYIIIIVVGIIGVFLISKNWKKASGTIIAAEKNSDSSNFIFSEEAYLLKLSKEISDNEFELDKDFPLGKNLSEDSLNVLIDKSIRYRLPAVAGYYLNLLGEINNDDSINLQAARYLVVSNSISKVEDNIYYLKSEQILNDIIERNPNDLGVLTLLGYLKVNSGLDPVQGIAMLQKVVEIDPNYTDALYILGDFSIDSGQPEKALERFKKLVYLQPQNSDYLFKVSEVFNMLNKPDSANYYFKLASEFKNNSTIK